MRDVVNCHCRCADLRTKAKIASVKTQCPGPVSLYFPITMPITGSMSAPIPRFLLPRGYALPYPIFTTVRRPWSSDGQTYPLCKRASTNAPPPKIIRLEQPAKFNPPSHGRRLKQQIPRHYGPALTQQQKVEQKTKKYPNMMPPEGSFMYWFLTSRGIHLFISLVRLGSRPRSCSSTH